MMYDQRRESVLVVDDEPRILSSIRDLLEDEFDVVTAESADTALSLIGLGEMSVIISDQRMPRMSGDEFLRKARELSHATRVLITGYADLPALVSAVNEGKIYGYISKPWAAEDLRTLVHNAAEHYRLSQELESERQQMHALMDNVPDCIYFMDAEGRVSRISQALARLLGLEDPAWAVGRKESDFADQQITRLLYGESRETIESGEPVIGRITHIKGTAGLELSFSSTKVPIRNDDGDVIGIVGISRDITDLRKLEEQLRHSQKMDAVGKLAGGVAHDFNNLLTVIGGYAELLLMRLPSGDPRRLDVEEIARAGQRAEALTRQLLAYSRQQVMQPRVLDLNTVLAEMEKMLKRLIGEDLRLVTRPSPDLGRMRADIGQIEQVILNLAVNARDAMPKGGSLLIETSNERLDEKDGRGKTAVQPGSYVLLAVSDTGCGMDPATLSRIFDPFFTTKEIGKGTGLGLSTVYGIVKQSGGYVWVDSEPGKGSVFRIYFPQVDSAIDAKAGVEGAYPIAAGGNETVLIVEDEEMVRKVTCEILRVSGYTVLEARNGEEALSICERHEGPIHLLMTDVVMPGLSGREVIEQAVVIRPEAKVLYTSGYTDDTIVRRGIFDDGFAFLQKPFTRLALIKKIREVLAGTASDRTSADDFP